MKFDLKHFITISFMCIVYIRYNAHETNSNKVF